MAVEIYLRKLYDTLCPADSAQAKLMESLSPNGEYKAVLSRPRNPYFHRKAFALASVGFDAWEPPAEKLYQGRPVVKNFDAFRDDLTIQAGFSDAVWTLDGEMRLIPHSWSWGKTDQLKFEAMYSAFIDVILRDILTNYTKDDLDQVVHEVLRFS